MLIDVEYPFFCRRRARSSASCAESNTPACTWTRAAAGASPAPELGTGDPCEPDPFPLGLEDGDGTAGTVTPPDAPPVEVESAEPGDDAGADVDPGAPGEPGAGPVATGVAGLGAAGVDGVSFGLETGGLAGGIGIVRSPPGPATGCGACWALGADGDDGAGRARTGAGCRDGEGPTVAGAAGFCAGGVVAAGAGFPPVGAWVGLAGVARGPVPAMGVTGAGATGAGVTGVGVETGFTGAIADWTGADGEGFGAEGW